MDSATPGKGVQPTLLSPLFVLSFSLFLCPPCVVSADSSASESSGLPLPVLLSWVHSRPCLSKSDSEMLLLSYTATFQVASGHLWRAAAITGRTKDVSVVQPHAAARCWCYTEGNAAPPAPGPSQGAGRAPARTQTPGCSGPRSGRSVPARAGPRSHHAVPGLQRQVSVRPTRPSVSLL